MLRNSKMHSGLGSVLERCCIESCRLWRFFDRIDRFAYTLAN
ncbi:hypothetical protein RMSM_00116 [Rhodopirellula maiorica SM1]|uniref:Uncharacterized protein n=1 Tax=Rhodopirellula maiorica SM1 TaxID=1265738 RepID=M5S5M5_9BACT|nr:hypothetical protein RMSM_00116 [Rhodopirellula maiorica SM1]